MMFRVLVASALLLAVVHEAAHAQLRGHGGPVRALAISPDGSQAVSGSFDTSVIRWSLQRNAAESRPEAESASPERSRQKQGVDSRGDDGRARQSDKAEARP